MKPAKYISLIATLLLVGLAVGLDWEASCAIKRTGFLQLCAGHYIEIKVPNSQTRRTLYFDADMVDCRQLHQGHEYTFVLKPETYNNPYRVQSWEKSFLLPPEKVH